MSAAADQSATPLVMDTGGEQESPAISEINVSSSNGKPVTVNGLLCYIARAISQRNNDSVTNRRSDR